MAEWAGSHLQMIRPEYWAQLDDLGVVPQPDLDAPARYRRIHAAMSAGLIDACHDLSEGGLALAVAEMMISGGLGAAITDLAGSAHDLASALFSESVGRHLIEVTPQNLAALSEALGSSVQVIGHVTAAAELRILDHSAITLADLRAAHHRPTAMFADAVPAAVPTGAKHE
jgi:phosphoribosylformylglycinamidine synthase